MDSWIMAGLLSVTAVTTTMGALGTMVSDRSLKIVKDFKTSPMRDSSLTGGYILSAVLIGIIMSLAALVLAEIYIVASGGELLGGVALLKTLGLIVLSSLAGTSLMLFFTTLFRSQNAYSAAGTIIGTLIGFITGIYLPIGTLPNAVQWVVKCFPISHAAALFRQTMMSAPLEASFAGAPEQTVTEFSELMGVTFTFGSTTASPLASIIILLACSAAFFLLSLFVISRKTD
jgi:multidrug/hemolysin transport system permease protein